MTLELLNGLFLLDFLGYTSWSPCVVSGEMHDREGDVLLRWNVEKKKLVKFTDLVLVTLCKHFLFLSMGGPEYEHLDEEKCLSLM